MLSSLSKEPMSYKQAKVSNQLVTKLRIIRMVKVDRWQNLTVASHFRCHRNTVGNLLTAFETRIMPDVQDHLLHQSFDHDALELLMKPLQDMSTKPHHHPLEASQDQVDRVKEVFDDLRVAVGPQRLQTMMRRKFKDSADRVDQSLASIKLTKLKGIYKRESLQIKKARATSGSRRSLYDYTALSCFEQMHLDTKHIRDKKALPPKFYDYCMAHMGSIPNYEWNLIDAKSRFRFVAYSYGINAEFGLKFLLFCLQFIRTMCNNNDTHCSIGYDNGVEFCAGSPLKLEDWNQLLSLLNASAYAYSPYFDIRKNLIERSHRSDDEELFIPRGEYIKTEADFMKETTDYWFHWNFERSHSGIGMRDRTPFEVVNQSGVMGGKRLMSFPVMLLEHHIESLRRCTEMLLMTDDIHQAEHKQQKSKVDQKTLVDIGSRYVFFNPRAQKVLTYYRKS